VQSTVSAPALFLRPNRPYLLAGEAQLARDWGSFAGAVRGYTLFKCRDGCTPGSHDSLPPHIIPPGEQGFSIPRAKPVLVLDKGPNKRVCFVLDPPAGRQSNADPDAPVTGHWAVRDLVARPIGEPLAPIPGVIEPLETIEEMELDDTKPEPQPVLPIQTMQQHLHSFQIYLDERRAQDEADARLADFANQIWDTTTDVNSSVSVSTKQTKSCVPSLCPAPILSVPRPLYSHSELQ